MPRRCVEFSSSPQWRWEYLKPTELKKQHREAERERSAETERKFAQFKFILVLLLAHESKMPPLEPASILRCSVGQFVSRREGRGERGEEGERDTVADELHAK